jgi:hypothetical protein
MTIERERLAADESAISRRPTIITRRQFAV